MSASISSVQGCQLLADAISADHNGHSGDQETAGKRKLPDGIVHSVPYSFLLA